MIRQNRLKEKEKDVRQGWEFQAYLLSNNILTLQEQRDIFQYWSRMNKLNYNFKETYIKKECHYVPYYLFDCKVLNNSDRTVQ